MLPDCLTILTLLSIRILTNSALEVSPEWKQIADLLHNAINESADPCDDFYTFACGNWNKVNPTPTGEPAYGVVYKLVEEMMANMTKLFHNLDPEKQPEAIRKAKIYYDTCMKAPTVSTDELLHLVKRLKEYGKWPMISQDWKGPVGGPWKNASALNGRLMGTLQAELLVTGVPTVDYRFPSKMGLELELQPLLTLANACGISLDAVTLIDDATKLAEMEVKLQNIYYATMPKKTDQPYHAFNVSSASKRWSFFDWRAMLTAAALDNVHSDAILSVPLLYNPEQMDKLGPMIKSATDREMQNLLLWRFLQSRQQPLPKQLANYHMFPKAETKSKNRDIFCINLQMEHLTFTSDRLYVDKWIKNRAPNTRQMLRDMVSFVLAAFKGMVHELNWMDEQSKQMAYKKVDNMVSNIAYSEWILNDLPLNNYYSKLHLNKDDRFYIASEKVARFRTWASFQSLLKPVGRKNMGLVADINAWYTKEVNSITFPAAILSYPILIINGPMAFNFGAIGSIMGHEMGHGFDDDGVFWGPLGAYDPLLSNKSMVDFNNMEKCLINQYDDFCFQKIGMCVNGTKTEGENIADNAGTMATYRAYTDWVELSGGEPKLPKPMSNYSMDQIFFLSFAHNFCGNVTDARLKQLLRGSHSPSHARVTQTLRNMPQFAKAFNCTVGSHMVPEKRCYTWVQATK